jgi:hypothetical protein
MDAGAERIADGDERATVRAQARRVHVRALVLVSVLTALALSWP